MEDSKKSVEMSESEKSFFENSLYSVMYETKVIQQQFSNFQQLFDTYVTNTNSFLVFAVDFFHGRCKSAFDTNQLSKPSVNDSPATKSGSSTSSTCPSPVQYSYPFRMPYPSVSSTFESVRKFTKNNLYPTNSEISLQTFNSDNTIKESFDIHNLLVSRKNRLDSLTQKETKGNSVSGKNNTADNISVSSSTKSSESSSNEKQGTLPVGIKRIRQEIKRDKSYKQKKKQKRSIIDKHRIESYIVSYKGSNTFILDPLDYDYIEEVKSMFASNNLIQIPMLNSIYKDTFFPDSTLLNDEYSKYLSGWLGRDKTWKLIFHAAKDGFVSGIFHQKCDNKGETVTIFKSHNNGMDCLFGGYTSLSWNGDNMHHRDPDSFIFTLKNMHDIPPTKYSCVYPDKAIFQGSHLGPSFGADYNNLGVSGLKDALGYMYSTFNREHAIYGDLSGYGNGLFTGTEADWGMVMFSAVDYEVFAIDKIV
ncbi:hypothetical protein WA158_008364 [Blastocystis sp. Blastoise]